MKKIISLFIIFIFAVSPVFAKKQKDYHINFRGNRYTLLYSIKSSDFGGYLNEYYKRGETYNTWSEMLAVHHFPNAYSPIDQVKQFKDYLGSMNCPSALTFNDKKNEAIIDFILISNNQVPIILEFNVFKYQKSKKCGSVALQYAKRYAVTTAMQVDEAKRDFEKSRKKVIKAVKNNKIPAVVAQEIDKCKFETEDKIVETTSKEEIITAENNNEIENISDNKEENAKIAEIKNTEIQKDKETEKEFISETLKENTEKEQQTEGKTDANIEIANVAEMNKENDAIEEDKDTNIIDTPKKETQTEARIEKTELAPVPNKVNETKRVNEKEYIYTHDKSEFYAPKRDYKKLRKEKKKEIKENNKKYTVEHDTSEQIVQKRDYKQLKKDKKKEIKEKKKQQKLDKKRIKEEKKAQTKKGKKERAKKAAKVLEAN